MSDKNLYNERYMFDQNIREKYQYEFISGSDEVGRGAMAGPIVVVSLILKKNFYNEKINDSKKVSKKNRNELYDLIIENTIAYSIQVYDNNFVDKHNPKKTSIIGMRETILKLKQKPDLCLVDGENVNLSDEYKVMKIIKGDSLSQTIGAASIVAKVYRDKIMSDFSKIYPLYAFENHVGYCTKKHINAVKKYGVLEIHRKTYKPIKNILKEN